VVDVGAKSAAVGTGPAVLGRSQTSYSGSRRLARTPNIRAGLPSSKGTTPVDAATRHAVPTRPGLPLVGLPGADPHKRD